MNSKFLALSLVGALALPVAMVSQGSADGGKVKPGRAAKLYAKFLPPAAGVTLPDEFKARVKYQRKVNSKGTEEEIDAKMLFAVPATTTTDLNGVENAGYLLRILTGATEKGSCVLLAKAIEFEYQSGVLAEFDLRYASKVQEKTTLAIPPTSTIKNRVGDCWVTTPVAPAVAGRGVPDVAVGDTVELSSLAAIPALPLTAAPTPGTLIVSGSFQTGYDHGDDEDDDD